MADRWLFKSETYDNCNCSVSCGCQFKEPTTHGNCHFVYVGTIVDGHFNDTPLAGLNWALLCIFPGEISEGNGKRQIVIDERADEAQRAALETIISGEACAVLALRRNRAGVAGVESGAAAEPAPPVRRRIHRSMAQSSEALESDQAEYQAGRVGDPAADSLVISRG